MATAQSTRIRAVAEITLSGRRVLLLGAETDVGRAIASALAEAGADLALVAATSDAEAAFAVQRLARRLSAPGRRSIAQAIDATNEAAVRVMTRQVSKELGGLDALVVCADVGEKTAAACRFAAREIARRGGGAVVIAAGAPEDIEALVGELAAQGVTLHQLAAVGEAEALAAEVLALLAGSG